MNLSYEIKTALTSIMEMAETILMESESSRISKCAKDIKNIGNTLFSVTNGIFELSRNELDEVHIIPVKYEINKVISDMMNMTSKRVRDHGLEYSFRISNDIPKKLYGDEARIKQIMLILIINAIKHTEYGKVSLDVSFDKKHELLYIKVSDTGIGIKSERIKNIFDCYPYNSDDDEEEYKSKGFGLYIVKQCVSRMNGYVECESEYGKGTAFTVCIPQAVLDDTPAVKALETYEVNPFEPGRYKPSFTASDAHILVVDDDQINIKIVSAMLKDTKIKISEASSGMECLEKIAGEDYDMILLDYMMPEMDGTEVLGKIKEKNLAEGVPIIAFTARDTFQEKKNFTAEGYDDCLQKPISFKKLERLLVEFLPEKCRLQNI